MPRIWIGSLFSAVISLVVTSAAMAQGPGVTEKLLPETTKGFVAITDYDLLVEQWNKTQIGQLLADPVMKPFAEDLRQQFRDRWAQAQAKVGLTLEDLRDVPSGEVGVALVQPSEDEAAMVVLADVTGNVDRAAAMLEKAAANLVRQGAKGSRQEVGDTSVMVFELADDPNPRHVVYFLSGNMLGAADNLGVIQQIILRMVGQPGPVLADVPAFAAVQQRCKLHAGDKVAQLRWFVEPVGYAQAARIAAPPEQRERRRGRTDMLEVLEDQGFDAVQGLGGFVDFAVDGFEILHRTAIYAPPPYQKAMRMVSLPNREQFAPPDWLPFDVATYTSFYWDVLQAFDKFGSLFDALFGEGETGVWEEVLQGLKEDPNGPQIDLREELVKHLDNRIVVITDYELPITTSSERLLFAIAARDPEAVAVGLKKTMENDPTVRRREFQGHVIWETVEQEAMPTPDAPRIDIPALNELQNEEFQQQQQDNRLLPHAAVSVAYGYLVVASHYDFLTKVMEQADSRRTLGRSVDYQVVVETMKRLGAGENCLRSFSRTDEEYRPTYELLRMGKMPESETLFGRLLNAILGPRKKGAVREQKIDARELPDYQVVRRYLGPAGLFAASEPEGWFIVGFTLPK